ncbi:acyl-CoA Delta(11) desaturase-like [Leptopilina boulardi]|uniref:acyl-CoA Delta(11) desaturase-like n=1 Tax=Leptopilina boulardi TaxID=63433 RepID=UPI0021F617B9|nr:acyl-CoA Delta(11) desaturase-like [Leptopilina boulardi]XP_051160107.1 acyl-CoA Delta(11) desaturase-like [Leptopilina boulardi]
MPPTTTNSTIGETIKSVSDPSSNGDLKEKSDVKPGLYDNIELQKPSKLGPFEFENELLWNYIIFFVVWHSIAIYAALTFPYFTHKLTALWMLGVYTYTKIGETAGAHRLYAHRCYKAKTPLRALLLLFYYSNGTFTISNWVKLHRIHHKYAETEADPTNSNRGFFFAHIGWLMMKKHPEMIRRKRQVDISDIKADPLVRFGDKYFRVWKYLLCFILPTVVPVYCWNESWYYAILSQCFIRYVFQLNVTFSANSFAHLWGHKKPYDKNIAPTEHKAVSIVTMGEGWHNYHHTFPWDYKAAELGDYGMNVTTGFIDLCAKLGLAYDLKQPSKDLIKSVCKNKGDGTHPVWKEVPEPIASH